MRVLLSQAAEADLAEIRAYIRADNPKRATTFALELFSACEAIGNMPLAVPVLPRFEKMGYRRKTFGNYLIFYRAGAEAVEIIRVIHGARDHERLLGRGR